MSSFVAARLPSLVQLECLLECDLDCKLELIACEMAAIFEDLNKKLLTQRVAEIQVSWDKHGCPSADSSSKI